MTVLDPSGIVPYSASPVAVRGSTMQGGEGNAAAGIATSEVIDVHEVVPGRPDTRDLVIDLREQSSDDEAVETTNAESGDESSAAAPPTGELHGRVAVVTGGASGVGREVALRLARAGARVCVLGRDLALLRDTVELAGPEAAILYLQCDVGSVSEIEGVVDFIDRFDRPVDLLVHAEGVHVRGGIEHGAVTDLDEQYLVNVRGPYLMSQRLIGHLREGGGHVLFVNPAPPSGVDAPLGQFAITTSGGMALADALRRELAGSGVRVTTIQPELPAGDPTSAAVAVLGPSEVAESVMHAVTVPGTVEITDIRLRPRFVAQGVRTPV